MKSLNDRFLGGYVRLTTLASDTNDRLDNWSESSSKHAKAEVAGGFAAGALLVGSGVAFAGETAAGGGGSCSKGTSTSQIVSLIETGGGFLAAIIAGVSVLYLLWASFQYITAGGNYGRAGKAKETAKNVVIGFGLAACIFILRSVILQIVGGASGSTSGSNSISSCLEGTGNSIK